MKGPVRRSERREAPIRCGFARTYVAGSRSAHAITARKPLRQRERLSVVGPGPAIKHTSSSANKSGDGPLTRAADAASSSAGGRRQRPRAPSRRSRPGRRRAAGAARCTVSKAAPRRRSWSETAVRSRPKTSQRLDDHDHPGDDGGGAVGVQSAHRAPLRLGQRGEASRMRRQLARDTTWPWTRSRITLQIQVDRPERGRRARHGDRCATPPRERSAAPPARRSRARPRPARASSSAVGGSVARWRSVWRTTPAWVETWKLTSSPLPTTSSVDPPPTSMTRVGVASPGARSLVAPRKVRRASSSPAMTRAWRP